MAWPTTAVATNDVITATQLNGLPVRFADVTLDADTAVINLANIPQVYAHLWLFGSIAGGRVGQPVYMTFNSDYSSNFHDQYLGAFYNTLSAGRREAVPGGGQVTSCHGTEVWTAFEVYIPHYAQTTNYKTYVAQYGEMWDPANVNGLGLVDFGGVTESTAAVASIQLSVDDVPMGVGTQITLIGLP